MYLVFFFVDTCLSRIWSIKKLNFRSFQTYYGQKLGLFTITNLILTTFYIYPKPQTLLINRYQLVMLYYLSLDLFYVSRNLQKYVIKFTAFFLKTESHFSSLIYFFFLQINTKKKLYANIPEIPKSNPKTSIQKYPIFAVGITFFIANVSDFTRILLVKVKNFEPSYLHEKLSYANTF